VAVQKNRLTTRAWKKESEITGGSKKKSRCKGKKERGTWVTLGGLEDRWGTGTRGEEDQKEEIVSPLLSLGGFCKKGGC